MRGCGGVAAPGLVALFWLSPEQRGHPGQTGRTLPGSGWGRGNFRSKISTNPSVTFISVLFFFLPSWKPPGPKKQFDPEIRVSHGVLVFLHSATDIIASCSVLLSCSISCSFA